MAAEDKIKIVCQECGKDFSSKQNYIKHFTLYHPKCVMTNQTTSGTTSTPSKTISTPSNTTPNPSNTTSTPAPSTSAAPTTPDNMAPADHPDPASATSSPAPAPNHVPTPEIEDDELSMDSELMDLWAEVQECVEKLTMDEIEPEKELENKVVLDEKVKRLHTIIAKKK